MRALILLPFLIWSTFAQDCSSFGRAVITDQKNMASDVALGYLGLDQSQVTKLQVSNYASWKENQRGCLANVIHYAKVLVETKQGNERCTTTLDLHTKDDFTSSVQFEREYKARNAETVCSTETEAEANISALCQSTPSCPREGGVKLVKDYEDNCGCKYFEDIIAYEDTGDQYDNFFGILNLVKKPEGLYSPFTK